MLVLLLLLLPGALGAQGRVCINEVLYAPVYGEPEWVELYNGTDRPVNLKNWKIRDATATRKTITTKDVTVPAFGYAVLARDTSVRNYHDVITAPVIGLSLPSLNNDSDNVILYDASGAVVDSLLYHSTWGGAGGASLERVRADAATNERTNWRTSRDAERSTPGRANSVRPPPIDVRVDSLLVEPLDASRFTLRAFVRNAGIASASAIACTFSVRGEERDVPIAAQTIAALAPTAGVVQEATTPRLIQSETLVVALDAAGDADRTNDTCTRTVTVLHRAGAVRITELMAAPEAPEPEWIELQNISVDTIGLRGWRVASSGAGALLPAAMLPPGAYGVFARDSGALVETRRGIDPPPHTADVPALPNTAGVVVLRDDAGRTMDSVAYRGTWGTAGRSLERIDSTAANDSTNWGASRDSTRATCGRRNSRARREIDLAVTDAIVDPAGTLVATVRNAGLRPVGDGRVCVSLGMQRVDDSLAALVLNLPPGASVAIPITLLPLPRGGNRLRICAEVDGDGDPENDCRDLTITLPFPPHALAINEILFAPHAGESEYVELVNLSDAPINLDGCRVHDAPPAPDRPANTTAIARTLLLAPGAYAVVAGDTTLFARYAELATNADVWTGTGSLGLNNDSDDVVVTDAAGAVLDSVRYHAAWHSANVRNGTGIALERVNPLLPANDRGSWASSVAARGGTPGARNSVFTIVDAGGQTVVPGGTALRVSPDPFSPDGDGRDDLLTIRAAVPGDAATLRLRVLDLDGRLIRTLAAGARAAYEAVFTWDGRDDAGTAVPIGIYCLLLDAATATTGASRATALVVVARR